MGKEGREEEGTSGGCSRQREGEGERESQAASALLVWRAMQVGLELVNCEIMT